MQGKFKDGDPDGNGEMTLPDLSKYDGEFSKGFFHGIGAFSIADAPNIYKGSWMKGKKHGTCHIFYIQKLRLL